jgi:hypothetical protein
VINFFICLAPGASKGEPAMDPTLLSQPTPPPPNPPMPQMPPSPPPAPPAKRSKWVYMGLGAIILLGLCCLVVVVGLLATYVLNRKASPAATAAPAFLPPATSLPLATLPPVTTQPPAIATIQPMPTATAPGVNSFHDDFSNANSGWLVQSTDNTDASYNPLGFYEMDAKKTDYYLVATSPDSLPRPLKNVIINVRARAFPGNTGEYGVVCRYQDIDNFYLASLSGNQFSIGKQVKGQWTYLTDPVWLTLPVKTPDADGYMTIGLSCIDSFIVLEVNGVGAAHVTDSEFSSGDAGLAVWAGADVDGAGFTARAAFDDFSLSLH